MGESGSDGESTEPAEKDPRELEAEAEYFGELLGEIVRRIVRATVTDTSGQKHYAAEQLHYLFQRILASGSYSPRLVVAKAVDELTVDAPLGSRDHDEIHAAQMGMRYLIESSSKDNAARGRAANRLREFHLACEDMLSMRRRR